MVGLQIFDRREFALHAIVVTDIANTTAVFITERARRLAIPANVAESRSRQAADGT